MKQLPKNAQNVMVQRYSLRDENRTPVESPAEILERTARVVAQAENNFRDGVTPTEVEERFVDLLHDFSFMPNGRTLANAGSGSGQLANCFVLPVEDELGKTGDGIFSILRKAVLVLQSGGGVGFSFGRVRPKGDVAGKGKATGAVSFLKVFDTAFWVIGQGGGRRSACMAVLPVHHPDIFDFIRCKEQEGVIEHFNISVGVTDVFMEAVEKDSDFDLINPRDNKVWETVRARDLMELIVEHAHHNGEPGVLFLDAANRENPVPHQYVLEATNPCFVGSTRIPTSVGLLQIEELERMGLPLTLTVDSRTSGGGLGAETVDASPAFVTGSDKKVYELQTKRGYRVTVTSDHQFYAGNGKYTKLKELTTGDTVYLQSGEGVWSSEWLLPNRHLFDFQAQQATLGGSVATRLTNRYPDIPDRWSQKLGVVLGWLVGDGWITRKSNSPLGFSFGKGSVGLEGLALVQEAMSRWFTSGSLSERERAWQLTFGKTPADFFASLGVGEQKASDKRVPEAVFSAPREAVIGFLQGLFGADGTVQISQEKQYCSVRLASSSQLLLEEVQLLLLNFGIVSSVLSRRKPQKKQMPNGRGSLSEYETKAQYELIIGKANRDQFAEVIGFASSEKQEKLESFIDSMVRGGYAETFVDTVVSITYIGRQTVYDITEPATHSLVGQGIVTHNCGEQWLGPYENCCMASVNLAEHVGKVEVKSHKSEAKSPAKELLYPYEVDWEKLKETVRWTVRWLDDVVEANKYVPAVPELEEAAHKNRRIGVSVMGMADMMYLMGVTYGSEAAVDLAGQLMEFIRYEAMQMSIELAEERGAFPGISGSIYDYSKTEVVNTGKNKNERLDKYGRWQAPKPIKKYTHDFGRPNLDWNDLIGGIKKHGIRNSCQTTIQPTGAIATVAALEGYGCEPVFALSYVMKTHEGAAERGEDWDELYYESDLFKQVLKRWNEIHDDAPDKQLEIETVFEKVRAKGTCLGVAEIPELIREVFVVSSDITVSEHVKMQAALQAFTDNAISKTINFPTTAQMDDVWEAYLEGWKLGLKGMTVYVTGSRETVVLETEETRSVSEKSKAKSQKLNGVKGKNGEKKKKKRQPETVDIGPLMNTSHEPFVVNGDSIVGKPLKKVHPEEMSCPECGSMMVLQEGCATCPACAYSHCSV